MKKEKCSNCIRRNIAIQPVAMGTKQALFQTKIAWKMKAPKEMHSFVHMLVQMLTEAFGTWKLSKI